MNHIDTDDTDFFISKTAMKILDTFSESVFKAYEKLNKNVRSETSDDAKQTYADAPVLFPHTLDQERFMESLNRKSDAKDDLRDIVPLALVWHSKIGDTLFGGVVRVLAKHTLADARMDSETIRAVIQQTAYDWVQDFSMWDLASSTDPKLKLLPALMEHDSQIARLREDLGSSTRQATIDRMFTARRDLVRACRQDYACFSEIVPSVGNVAEAIAKSLDNRLANAMKAIQEINLVRAQMDQDNVRNGGAALADQNVLPVRVGAINTDGDPSRNSSQPFTVQKIGRRSAP